MNGRLSFRFFAHSWISDWNHGNAHFLRGLASELVKLGHEVRCYEERDGWAMRNLAAEPSRAAAEALIAFRRAFPALALKPELRFRALFHDTHHRAYTSPKEILRFPLSEFDGVLAFGQAIRQIYSDGFGVKRSWTFHEAADVSHFFSVGARKDIDVVWIGNWGDEERTRELEEFLMAPAAAMRECKFAVHGVRYPEIALDRLSRSGIEFRGYLPNLRAPEVYGRSKISLHVPRKFYANGLSGVPTIRVFEALAASAPLICAPWSDSEQLFRPGEDYLCVPDSKAMIAALRNLLHDDNAREQLGASGRQTILARHTCAHRAQQLVEICRELEN